MKFSDKGFMWLFGSLSNYFNVFTGKKTTARAVLYGCKIWHLCEALIRQVRVKFQTFEETAVEQTKRRYYNYVEAVVRKRRKNESRFLGFLILSLMN